MLQPDGAGFTAYLEGEPVDAEIRGAAGHRLACRRSPRCRWSGNGSTPASGPWSAPAGTSWWTAGTSARWCFPDADLKIFLTASPEARAGRRISQRGPRWTPGRLEAEAAALAARDHADSSRAVAPAPAGGRRRPARHHHAWPSPSRSAGSWSWPARSSARALSVRRPGSVGSSEPPPTACPTLR